MVGAMSLWLNIDQLKGQSWQVRESKTYWNIMYVKLSQIIFNTCFYNKKKLVLKISNKLVIINNA